MTMVMVMMVMSMMKVLTGVTMMMLITLSELRRKGGLEQGAGADPQEGDRGKVSTLCAVVQNFTGLCKLLPSCAKLCKLLQSFTRFCGVMQTFTELCKILQNFTVLWKIMQSCAKLCRVGKVVYKLSILINITLRCNNTISLYDVTVWCIVLYPLMGGLARLLCCIVYVYLVLCSIHCII